MMTDSQKSFVKVKLWFSNLIAEPASEQKSQINQLRKDGTLDDKQIKLLQDMLQADQETSMATNIESVSSEIIEEATAQEPTFENKQIGSYKIISTLGEGGMGQVYLAERNDGQFQQKVALKLPHSSFNQHMLERFENERQILAQLTHNNIAHLLDGGTAENNQPYLVMEYIQGKNIDEYCSEKIPNLQERLQLILQVCAAVTFSHQQLVLHRDLKPSNILVTETGQVKLLDFGIAKLLNLDEEAKAKLTATQIMTRYYASPEQLQGKPASTHSDMFSLAIIAYELITGYHPFKHETQHEREQNLISGKIMRVTQRTDEEEAILPALAKIPSGKLQGDLENILLKALSVDPNKRYESVREFADDLLNFIKNKPVTARKPSLLYNLKKWTQRNKAFAALSLFTLFSLIFATVYSINKANLALKQQMIAEFESEKAMQVSGFLKNIFNNAVPEIAKKEITAQDLLMQALDNVEKNHFTNQESKFELLALIHDNLVTIGKYQDSFEHVNNHYAECVLALNESNNNCQMLLIVKGRVLKYREDYPSALEIFKKAENIYYRHTKNEKSEIIEINALISNVYRNLVDHDKANEYSTKSVNIELKSDEPDFRNIHDILHNQVNGYAITREFENGKRIIEQIPTYLAMYPEDEKPMKMVSYYGQLGFFYSKFYQSRLSFENRLKSIQILEENFELLPQRYGWHAFAAGSAAVAAGELKIAEELYSKAKDFYLNNVEENEMYLYRIGVRRILMHIMSDNANAAIKEYQEIEKIFTKNPSVLRNFDGKHKIVTFYVDLQSKPKEFLEPSIKELHDFLSIKFDVEPSYLVRWLVMNAFYAKKFNDQELVNESINRLNKILENYPEGFIGTKNLINYFNSY